MLEVKKNEGDQGCEESTSAMAVTPFTESEQVL